LAPESSTNQAMDFVELNRQFVAWRAGSTLDPHFLRLSSEELSWDDLLKYRRVVVLAEGGSGKSEEFRNRAAVLSRAGRFAIATTVQDVARAGLPGALRAADEARYRAWKDSSDEDGWFFIDSIDEAKRNTIGLQQALIAVAKGILGAERRAYVVLSGRHTEWESSKDLASLMAEVPVPQPPSLPEAPSANQQLVNIVRHRQNDAKATPGEEPLVVVMNPLSREQVAAYASGKGTPDAAAFLKALERSDAMPFAARPLDLGWLVTFWREQGRVGSLQEMVEASLTQRLRESNPTRAAGDALDTASAWEGLERLGAAMVFSGKESVEIPDSSDQPDPDAVGVRLEAVLPDWSPSNLQTLLSRPVFEPAAQVRTRLHNDNTGTIRSFLAARWLARLKARNLTRPRLNQLLFARTYDINLVRPRLRATAAWLAGSDVDVAKEVASRDPGLLVEEGDPSSLTCEVRTKILENIVTGLVADPKLRSPILPFEGFKRFAKLDLVPCVRILWERFHTYPSVRQFLVHIIWIGNFSDCADLVESTLIEADEDEVTKVILGRALLSVGRPEAKARYAKRMLQDAPQLDKYTLWEALVELFPSYISLVELIEVLKRLARDNAGLADALDENGAKLVEQLTSRADLTVLLKELLDLLGGRFGRLAHQPTAEEERYSSTIRAVGRKILELSPDDAADELVLDAALRVTERHDRQARNRPDSRSITALLHKTSARRRAAFWHAASRLSGHPELYGRTLEHYWDMEILGYNPGLGLDDLNWLIADAYSRTNAAEKRLAVFTAVHLWRSAGSPVDVLSELQALAGADPVVAAAYRESITPHEQSEEIKRFHKENSRLERRNAAQMAAHDRAWLEFFEGLKANPAQLDTLRPPDKNGIDSRLFNLWNLLFSANSSRSIYSIDSLGNIEPLLGPEVSRRLCTALQSHWRLWRPTLDSEKDAAKRSNVSSLDCMGVCGVAMEAAGDPAWADKLSYADAVRAAQFATIEINGIPKWVTPLATSHPGAVREVFLGEVKAEMNEAEDRTRLDLLQDLSRASHVVANVVAGDLFKLLQANPVLPESALRPLLDVLLHGFSDQQSRKQFATLISRRAKSASDSTVAALYLGALFELDPMDATKVLSAKLGKLATSAEKTDLAKQLLPDLFGGGFGVVQPRLKDLPFSCLEMLVRIAYETIRLSEDNKRVNGGVYSPNQRDHAEDARGYAFRLLVNTPGRATFELLKRLAEEGGTDISPEQLRRLARERAESDSNQGLWTLSEPYAFEDHCESQPKTPQDLQDLALERLAEMQDDLVNGDFNQGSVLKALPSENAVQNWVADRFRLIEGRSFTSVREPALAGEKKPDLRLFAKGATSATLSIEIKVAKDCSLKQLEHALRVQLCRQYLRAAGARHGVLLIVHQGGRTRGWKVNGTDVYMDFDGLVKHLSKMAAEICARAPDSEQPVVATLDVSQCLTEEGKKGAAKTPAKKARASRLRFTAKGIAAIRSRLGLTAEAFGLLVGVSALTVNSWEGDHSSPRTRHKAKLADLRRVGRNEATRRLEAFAAPDSKKSFLWNDPKSEDAGAG
jgi:DNA-binding transcriptional regulator YiaG